MRRMMRSLSLRQFSDDLIGSCLCTSFVSTCQDTPLKINMSPKKGPFCSRTWNIFEPSTFRGYSLGFHGDMSSEFSICSIPMVDGWWFMWKFSWRPAHTVAITERRKPLGFISKPCKRRYPLFLSFSELLHFLQEIVTSWIISQSSLFYFDAIFMTQMAERKSTSGKVLVQCFMLVSRLKSRHMLHDMAFAKSNSRWSFQILFFLSLLGGNDPIWLRFFKGVETTN